MIKLMAYFSARGSVHSPLPTLYNVTNISFNMTPGYLVFQPDQAPSDTSSPHQTTHRATVIAFMGVFVFITLTLTTAIILFCKKKNSVFFLQKSDLHADLDVELEEIQTDISDDFGSFTLEITDVNQSVSEQQDLGQCEALLTNTMKQSKSLPTDFNSCQEYTKLQHLPAKYETCEELQTSSTPLSCQIDSVRKHQLDVTSNSCGGLLSEQTDTPSAEQLFIFPADRIMTQEDSD
ncbi:uncharacterized protein LOC125661556 [Ostrea edulis]|uniref:uncharacterized protein LOC125661556 n=1 Tax=Ostrea edulis TaxID=37623 RepID=UPI002094F362|nr:uncharacterized protein LOC125661556 [Ostrea edulis]XP_056003016.1 uncharacterized protein LOC125661556 [Ostrea edulis]